MGLDDFTEVKPAFDTSYTVYTTAGAVKGSFDLFINEDLFDPAKNTENKSWYSAYSMLTSINENVDYGNILLLGDSFSGTLCPFLSLSVHEIHPIVMRSRDESFRLEDYIAKTKVDTVIISYAQLMLGAHDNPNSPNYNIYRFYPDIN